MKERDCANCKHHTSDGCSSWDCEYKPNDLISRADAIELAVDVETPEGTYESAIYVDDLMALPSADAEWIPCSERLPEKDDLVLVTVWNDVTIAWRNIYGGWESAEDMYEKGDVIAWMPLPTPYKGGDTE